MPSDSDAFGGRYGSVPIPIRPELTVRVQGIPHDLTEEEATKICAVILAFMVPTKEASDAE